MIKLMVQQAVHHQIIIIKVSVNITEEEEIRIIIVIRID